MLKIEKKVLEAARKKEAEIKNKNGKRIQCTAHVALENMPTLSIIRVIIYHFHHTYLLGFIKA